MTGSAEPLVQGEGSSAIGKKVRPVGHSPAFERRHVGKECAVTREILRRVEPDAQWTEPIRGSPEGVLVLLGKSEGLIVLLMDRTTEPGRRGGALLQSEGSLVRKDR